MNGAANDLSPTRRRWLLAAVMSGLLLAMLDQSIVGTALPTIVQTLGGNDLYVWVATAYLVPATVSLPIYARLSDRHGRRALLLIGMVLFLLGSGLAATAQNMEQLIGYRALQGLGAGALEGLSFILVADLFAGRRSAALQGALAGLMGVSFILGPLVGGFLTDHVGWQAVFTVNLPIGIAALAVVATVLPASIGRSERRGTPLDLAGIALLTARRRPAAGRAQRAPRRRSSPAASSSSPASSPSSAAPSPPMIPLKLFADRKVAAIMVAGATSTFGLFAGALLLPRYFQQVRDVSATHSGLLIYPLLLGILVSVNVAGALIARRLEFRGTVLAGAGLAALGALGFATFDASTPDWQSLIFMGLIGPRDRAGAVRTADRADALGRPAADRRRDGQPPAPAPGRRRGGTGERRDRLPLGPPRPLGGGLDRHRRARDQPRGLAIGGAGAHLAPPRRRAPAGARDGMTAHTVA